MSCPAPRGGVSEPAIVFGENIKTCPASPLSLPILSQVGESSKISSPALTAVDLIHHQTKLGGINRMLAILEELIEEITQNDISELLTWYSHKSTLQRFGFLLEELQANKELIKPVSEHLKTSKYYPVLLTPKSGQKPGSIDNDWKVDVNIKLESDI